MPGGNYYVYAEVRVSDGSPPDPTPGNDYDRTDSSFSYSPIDVDLVCDSVSLSTHSAAPGETLTATRQFSNTGSTSSGAFDYGFFLSTNQMITTSDTLLYSYRISDLAGGGTNGPLGISVTIPTGTLTATLGVAIYPVSGESTRVALSQVFRTGVVAAVPSSHELDGANGDAQYVLVLGPDSTILQYSLWDLSNAQSWQDHTFDLTAFAGRTIWIHLGVYNDRLGGRTGMYVDDVSLVITPPVAVLPERVYVPIILRDHP